MKKTCEVKNMKTGMNSIRVADTLWLDDGRFGRLLDLLDRYPGDIKQVSLFTAGTHVPLPLYEMRRRCDIIKDSILGKLKQFTRLSKESKIVNSYELTSEDTVTIVIFYKCYPNTRHWHITK